MAERTVTLSSLGKTFSATGWKIGWALGPRALVEGVLRAHQFITFAVASPLQSAAAVALSLPDDFYDGLRATFQSRRDFLMGELTQAGFEVYKPQGGYFVMADWRPVAPSHVTDDLQFARWLIEEVGVACIPPSAFYQPVDKHLGRHLARFAVCKKQETLAAAAERLRKMKPRAG
jgi:N-succinyldiaminopimelate aminotransferase